MELTKNVKCFNVEIFSYYHINKQYKDVNDIFFFPFSFYPKYSFVSLFECCEDISIFLFFSLNILLIIMA